MTNGIENLIWELYQKGASDLEIAEKLGVGSEEAKEVCENRKQEQEREEREKQQEKEHNEELDKEIEGKKPLSRSRF